MTRLRPWLTGARRSHSVWFGLVAASVVFMFPLLFATLTGAGGRSAGEWQPVGLQGETVMALSVVSRDDGTALYVQTHSGLWRKMDDQAGTDKAWERIDQDLPHTTLGMSLVVAWCNVPGRPLDMYALAGLPETRQLYRSVDGGSSWQPVGLAPGQSKTPALAVSPGATGSPDSIMIVTASGLQRSLDGGASWELGGPWPEEPGAEARLATGGVVRELLVGESGPDRLLALSHAGELWTSDNGGLSWRGVEVQDHKVSAAAFSANRGEWVSASSQGRAGLFFRPDGTSGWDARSLPERTSGPFAQGNDIVALAAEPLIRDSVYIASRAGRVYRTGDGGATWEILGAPRGMRISTLAVLPEARSTLYAATDDGVWSRPVVAVSPTATPTYTLTPWPSSTPEPTATATRPTATPSPTPPATETMTPSPTTTPTLTATATATPTSTRVPPTPTRKPTSKPRLPTPTYTATAVRSSERPEPPPRVEPTSPPQVQPTSEPQPLPTPPIRP